MSSETPKAGGFCLIPIETIQIVDDNVLAALPGKPASASIAAHGFSNWTRTARIGTKRENSTQKYFLKTSFGALGEQMAQSEYTAMSRIVKNMPNFVPKPIAHGRYASNSDVFFFLSEFREMTNEIPNMDEFVEQLAKMHKSGTSADGRFGFPAPTFHGNTRIEHPWCDSWEEYFTVTTKRLLELEQSQRGKDVDIDELTAPFFETVVPRLLQPLESKGRQLRPALIHGDLWDGNVACDKETGRPLIFDAACFYAHNEYELGVWRQSWNKLSRPEHIQEYLRHFPKSAPGEDFEARNELYAVRVEILDSILYKDETQYRESLLRGMRSLVDRFV